MKDSAGESPDKDFSHFTKPRVVVPGWAEAVVATYFPGKAFRRPLVLRERCNHSLAHDMRATRSDPLL